MQKWLLIIFLGLQAHFVASYLVPLDKQSQGEFGGLLRWFWPRAQGDSGLLGQMTASGVPLPRLYLTAVAGGLILIAALAPLGLWVPCSWWRTLTIAGAAGVAGARGALSRAHQAASNGLRPGGLLGRVQSLARNGHEVRK